MGSILILIILVFSVVEKMQKKRTQIYRKSRIADEWARYPVDPPLSAGQSQSRHSDAEEHVEEVFVFVFLLIFFGENNNNHMMVRKILKTTPLAMKIGDDGIGQINNILMIRIAINLLTNQRASLLERSRFTTIKIESEFVLLFHILFLALFS